MVVDFLLVISNSPRIARPRYSVLVFDNIDNRQDRDYCDSGPDKSLVIFVAFSTFICAVDN